VSSARSNAYLEAVRAIPSGQTRTFSELAALAGRPGAARAAGRALAACPDTSELPWHRVVGADGRLRHEREQLRRLRREGARPRSREPLKAWAARVDARFVGSYPLKVVVPRDDCRAVDWDPRAVEPFPDAAVAFARGFLEPGAARRSMRLLPTARRRSTASNALPLEDRLRALAWAELRRELTHRGVCKLPSLLTPGECNTIIDASTRPDRFDRGIDMLSKGYGVGSYHYYREPLPEPANRLRAGLYETLRSPEQPKTLAAFWERCRRQGQRRASSILIGYPTAGVNHPHRDVYGPVFFPFQALILLSRKGRDFTGGDFYVEDEDSRTRTTVSATKGDVVLFATRNRTIDGRSHALRHGMTAILSGQRFGLGMVFHLAE